ncbi:MAG: GxxExxY protein [Planctomycetaceae bacterium]|nr:GxxExxY protein [Planctomycetaceae bacterium]MCA9112601.1 GxxExxY protein [Planctomycetaceae bacterium]
MHPQYERANGMTHDVIGAGIEVHRELGPGLLESIYEKCLLHELELRGHQVIRQQQVQIRYKDIAFQEDLRFDLLIDACLLVEVKCVQEVHPIHKAQLLSYMKLLNIPVGLVMNFYVERLTEGIHRMYLPGANRD